MARRNGLHNFLDFLDILFEFLAKNYYSQNIPTACLVWGLNTFVALAKHNGLYNFLDFLSSFFEFLVKNYYIRTETFGRSFDKYTNKYCMLDL